MHGYQDRAESVMRRLGWLDNQPPFKVLAINGPFPAPVWTGSGFLEAYSWYFRDTDRKLTLIPPTQSAKTIADLVRQIGLDSDSKVIVGFSQGGLMAPFLASQLRRVKAIVTMSSPLPAESYKGVHPLPVYALHGSKDERVPIDRSRDEHQALMRKGFGGEFIEFPKLIHKVDLAFSPKIIEICQAQLGMK